MGQIDRLKFEAERLSEIVDRQMWDRLAEVPTSSRSTASALTAESLLDLAERFPPEPAATVATIAGIPVVVSEYVPTGEDRLVRDRRPLLRRMFSGQLCGVRAEWVSCDHIFLVDDAPDRSVFVSPFVASLLRVYPGGTLTPEITEP